MTEIDSKPGTTNHGKEDHKKALRTHLILSAARFSAEDFEGAMPHLQAAELICRQVGDKRALYHTLGHIAVVIKKRGAPDEALLIHQEEESLCRELGDDHGLAFALLDQARILCDKHKVTPGLDLYLQAEEAARRCNNNESLFLALFNTAYYLFYETRDPVRALPKCREALSLTDTLRVYRNEKSNTVNLLEEIESEIGKA
ncbi:MAG: hypothetical protein NT004_07950 [Bacteroidetes bacterium]|nr:hypothetical protein [Bacteroidota bacterium]